jgi:hypothetical protein
MTAAMSICGLITNMGDGVKLAVLVRGDLDSETCLRRETRSLWVATHSIMVYHNCIDTIQPKLLLYYKTRCSICTCHQCYQTDFLLEYKGTYCTLHIFSCYSRVWQRTWRCNMEQGGGEGDDNPHGMPLRGTIITESRGRNVSEARCTQEGEIWRDGRVHCVTNFDSACT